MPELLRPRALIIGGGIGGLAAAVALRKVGINAHVFERAPEIHEVGAGLSLWSNAITALRRLGLEERIVALGTPILRMRSVTTSGEPLNETNVEELSHKAGAFSLGVHRADLQRVLLEALPAHVLHTDATCTGVDVGEQQITAHFADGRLVTGDLLIGADGLQSVVRAQLFGLRAPRYAGYTCWRGLADFAHPALPLDQSLIALGPGTHMGLFHCGAGRVFWFVTKNAPAGELDPQGGHQHAALSAFAYWHPTFRTAIEATPEAAMLKNDIFDRRPIRVWGKGRVTLLGDAAHPTTPNLGQGACQALEDAVVLADSLRHATGVVEGLRRYEDRRRDRTAYIITQSRLLGRMGQVQNRAAVWLRNWSARTAWGRRQGLKAFEALFLYAVPELER